ncbi:DUF222 domain-containing protein [Blastococcus sp. TML/M2B]|uniref:HNH endonuclease signature motif containing protein n=1 Tax=Blastococcus sp. TML/M2B TaxID=2798727 RepID=UPI00281564E5|nr:DUF222 domain-containing protein [Blastococcus sp. TML/M2B]
MQTLAGTSVVEGMLIDWVAARPEAHLDLPAEWLDDVQVAGELGRIERDRARQTAREALLILRLAELRPDTDDPAPGTPGARRRSWRKTDPEFAGVSEFFVEEVAHALNLGRGTAAFRARRAFTWRDNLPATFALLRRGEIDERRAGVLADALQATTPALAQAVEAALLPGAGELSLARLRERALALLAELDAAAVEERRAGAQRAADVRVAPTVDGMATLTGELTVEEAAACYAVIDQLAAMAKADGDERPIGQIRAAVMAMLILRPADHGLGGVSVQLTVTAALDGLAGDTAAGGEVAGFAVTAAQLRELLARVEALGLTTPAGGSLSFALTDQRGRLLATVTAGELARLAAKGCPQHPDADADADADDGCGCAVLGVPEDTAGYEPRAGQRRFVATRDRRCRMPNCGQRVGWADLDHVVAHAEGGATSCANLCCACRSHHRLKTFARGWRFRMDPDGTLHVTSPSGITRTTRPPGLRPPEPPPSPPDPADDPPPF